MDADPAAGDGFDLDVLAASVHADGDDVRVLLRVLVGRLAGVLGDRLDVERAGGRLFRKSDDIRRVSIHLGDDQLNAVVDHGALVCTVARSSGGIRIRSTKVTVDQWLRQLLGALRDEAAHSQSTREVLESLVVANRLPGQATDGQASDGQIANRLPGQVGTGQIGDGPAAVGDGGGR